MPDDPRMSAPAPAPAGSIRLIFEYEGDQVRLISQQPVDVVAPPGASLPRPGERDLEASQAGFRLEVRNADDNVLYRQAMHDPIVQFPEVFSEQPGANITRSTTPAPRGAFTAVVPSLPAGDHVSLIRSAPTPGTRGLPGATTRTGEIARFALHPGGQQP